MAALLAALSGAAAADDGEEKPYAVVAGTVFRTPGFALAGAEVTIVSVPPDGKKPKRVRLTANTRGEFALRVPAVPLRHTVSVKQKGFLPQEKTAQTEGGERIDLNFELEPEAKP